MTTTRIFTPLVLVAATLQCARVAAQTTTTPVPVERIAEVVTNAPVAPEAIYIGRRGGLSVIDLNGFGQGTGSIAHLRDPQQPFGFKRNPNIGRPGLLPQVRLGTSNRDAGSSGALTLTTDSSMKTLLGDLTSADAIAVGQPLDLVYNNENINRNAISAMQVNPWSGLPMPGNTIAVAPHPNPPALVEPSPNPWRGVDGSEPTATTSIPVNGRITVTAPPCFPSPLNHLKNGDPFALNAAQIGVFHQNFDGVFNGPQPAPPSPPPPPPFCPFTARQQIGHFLYVLEGGADRIAVLNSNRMTRLATIAVPSPSAIAMAPHLKLLAVASAIQGTVTFIDTDPKSRLFHKVVATLQVSTSPTCLAWQPEGEALIVGSSTSASLSIIDGASFQVGTVSLPAAAIDVAVSSRQFRIGIDSWTWFAYVLHQNGGMSVYESGPQPFGPDRVWTTALSFAKATKLHIAASVEPGCYVAHQDAGGLGQVSLVTTTITNQQRLTSVATRYGGSTATTPVKDRFSGQNIVDIAFDEMKNLGAHPEYQSALLPSLPHALHSGKSLARFDNGKYRPTYEPRFLFVALADSGRVDVVEISTGRVLRSLDAQGVRSLGHYFDQ